VFRDGSGRSVKLEHSLHHATSLPVRSGYNTQQSHTHEFRHVDPIGSTRIQFRVSMTYSSFSLHSDQWQVFVEAIGCDLDHKIGLSQFHIFRFQTPKRNDRTRPTFTFTLARRQIMTAVHSWLPIFSISILTM